MKGNNIPTYDIYKKLESDLQFECWTLSEVDESYDPSQPHRHNYYEIFFFSKSGGTHEIDFQVYPIKKNVLHFVSPEQVHLLKCKPSVDGYVVSFTKEFCSVNSADKIGLDDFPFFNNPYSPPVLELKKIVQQKILLDLVKELKSEFNSTHEDKADILRSYLQILLIQLRRLYQPAENENAEVLPKHELVRKFKSLIGESFIEKKSVSEYAQLLNISAGHLNDTVSETTGKTASELIHERIILETKRLLYHSEKSVKEISYHLNYDDPSYFAKFFKNHAGFTPEAFRQQIREKHH